MNQSDTMFILLVASIFLSLLVLITLIKSIIESTISSWKLEQRKKQIQKEKEQDEDESNTGNKV